MRTAIQRFPANLSWVTVHLYGQPWSILWVPPSYGPSVADAERIASGAAAVWFRDNCDDVNADVGEIGIPVDFDRDDGTDRYYVYPGQHTREGPRPF